MARYSLLLVGGADANRVTAKLASKLPLQVTNRQITIDGKSFDAKDAALQMMYPNPLNPDRYVLIVASTSTEGMYFNQINPQQLPSLDYVITDGRLPAYKQKASGQQVMVVTGMFDNNWRFSSAYAQPGDSAIRANARLRHRPNPDLVVKPALLDSYSGRYQITQGPLVEIHNDGKHLTAKIQGAPGDGDPLLPETDTNFYLQRYNLWLTFVRDASGKVTGFYGFQNGDFEATKLE